MKPIGIALTFIITLLLVSCGGAMLAEGGTGGTGVTTGTVQGYGSLFVNDVEFDVSDAVFLRNGQPAPNGEQDYAVGEVVTIKGRVSDDGATGTADEVIYEDLLKGRVTLATADYIQVLGQDVMIDGKTVFSGFSNPESLVDRYVEVSGFRTADGAIRATNIKVQSRQDGEYEITGVISSVGNDNSFSIGGLVVEYTEFPGGDPEVGQVVEVSVDSVISDNRVLAREIELVEREEYEQETQIEVEGLITEFTSETDFAIASLRIMTDSETTYENGTAADLGVDVRVQVKGSVDTSGSIHADRIKIEAFTSENAEVEIVAVIDSLNPGSSAFTILGLVAVTDSSTDFEDKSSMNVAPFRYEDLMVGDRVDIDGRMTGGNTMQVEELRRRDPASDVRIEGALSHYTEASGQLVVSGISVQTDASTIFRGPNEREISAESFYRSLVEGVTDLDVRGTAAGSEVLAETIEIDD